MCASHIPGGKIPRCAPAGTRRPGFRGDWEAFQPCPRAVAAQLNPYCAPRARNSLQKGSRFFGCVGKAYLDERPCPALHVLSGLPRRALPSGRFSFVTMLRGARWCCCIAGYDVRIRIEISSRPYGAGWMGGNAAPGFSAAADCGGLHPGLFSCSPCREK